MGNVTQKEPRRISFDNTFAVTSPISIQKSMETENDIVFDNIPIDTPDVTPYKEKIRDSEEGDGDYWSNRIEILKKEHKDIIEIKEKEYDKTLEAASVNFESPKVTLGKIKKVQPCLIWRKKILKCYEENSRQSLVCAPIVQAFSKCVTDCKSE